MTGKLSPARWSLKTHQTGKRMKALAAALGTGAFIGIVVLATALGGGAHATATLLVGAGKTSIVSTPPPTPATSIAAPTVTATPYGGEGP